MKKKEGFALAEVLIAVTILSIILLSVYSGISSSINVIREAGNHTRAMIYARSSLNEFVMNGKKGPDFTMESVPGTDKFFRSRKTESFEGLLSSAIPLKQTTFTISWREHEKEKKYSVSYVYSAL